MSKHVDSNGKIMFDKYDFESWSIEKRLEFLEMSIEFRLKNLNKHVNPKLVSSAMVIIKRKNLPLGTSDNIKYIKELYPIGSKEFERELSNIELEFYGALDSTGKVKERYSE